METFQALLLDKGSCDEKELINNLKKIVRYDPSSTKYVVSVHNKYLLVGADYFEGWVCKVKHMNEILEFDLYEMITRNKILLIDEKIKKIIVDR